MSGGCQRQASTSVQHLVLPSHWSQRNAMVPDLVRCYGACGRTIVFTETKRDANDLVTALGDSVRALHGDIPQVCRGDLYHCPPTIVRPQRPPRRAAACCLCHPAAHGNFSGNIGCTVV